MTLFKDEYRIESARLGRWNYRDPAAYFVTICVQGHAPLLGRMVEGNMQFSQCGQIANLHLHTLPDHYNDVTVDCYVVMPNHVHAIVVIGGQHVFSRVAELRMKPCDEVAPIISPESGSLAVIMRSYKSGVARECHLAGFPQFSWQSRYYDHIIRSDASLHAIRQYIQENPKNWAHDPDHL